MSTILYQQTSISVSLNIFQYPVAALVNQLKLDSSLIFFSHGMASVTNKLSEGCKAAKRAVLSAPPNDTYLRWDAPGVETIKPDKERSAEDCRDDESDAEAQLRQRVNAKSRDQMYPMRC